MLRDPDFYRENRNRKRFDEERLQTRYLYEIAERLDRIATELERQGSEE